MDFPSPAGRKDAGAFQGKVAVGSPDIADVSFLEEDQARGVHVGELVAAQEIELASHGSLWAGSRA